MANQEHLDILKQGVDIWNQWRKEHFDIQPDLSGSVLSCAVLIEINLNRVNLSGVRFNGADLRRANLIEAYLVGANLSRANLSRANLSRANLSEAILDEATLIGAHLIGTKLIGASLVEANLEKADLSRTNLYRANLSRVNLSQVYLNEAIIEEANLSQANLSQANLSHAILHRAILSEVQFRQAIVSSTMFGDADLSVVKGLDEMDHPSPSTIGIDTVYRSQGNISEAFLRGVGVDDTFITYIRSLIGKPIDFYSCFISYSSKDQAFAERLHADLQSRGVRCWFAPEDMKIGDEIRSRIDESIRIYDKLLLVLSEHSVESIWVKKEVETAFEKESQQKRSVLFPVRLDDAAMHTTKAWAADIRRTRHIGDFTPWKNHDEYQKAFARLLRDLKSEINNNQ